MSTVDQMLAQFRSSGGAARGNRYRITFVNDDSNKLNIFCDSVSWPGRQIITSDYMTSMKSFKRPYAFANEDVNVSFILSNDWYTWNYLKGWQSSVINNIDTVTGAYTINLKRQYTKQVLIEHLNEQDQVNRFVTLFDAYPTTLNSMELSNANENTIMRCTAVFSYDNWSSENTQERVPAANAIPTDFGISTIV